MIYESGFSLGNFIKILTKSSWWLQVVCVDTVFSNNTPITKGNLPAAAHIVTVFWPSGCQWCRQNLAVQDAHW